MADSAALSRSNLYTQSFWNFFNLINNRSNVVDPTDASGNRKFVHAHDPLVDNRGFPGYPYVFLNPARPSNGSLRMADDKSGEVTCQILCEVRSSDVSFRDNTASDPHGKGLTWLDQISDDIFETLNDQTNRSNLRINNIGFVELDVGNVDYVDVNGGIVYVREFTINFRVPLLTVSA